MPAENFESEAKKQTADHSQALFSDFCSGFKKGGLDEVEFNRAHSDDAMLRAGMAAGVGYITAGKESRGSTALKLGVVGGVAISAGHFVAPAHLEDMAAKSNTDSKFGYLSGRFLADAIPTIALTTVANRASWNMKGEKEVAAIIDRTEFKWGVHKVTHTESAISPVFKQDRAESLFNFLEKRGQPEKFRSKTSTAGRNMAGARALWRATGMKDADFQKPIIAVVNSFTQFVPGHVHLKDLGQLVAREIEAAGGVAKEFNTIAVDDGIAMGHDGMLYSLPSRDIIADSVEYMVNAHCADALVCISNCDKITPGMLMAAMRLNIPVVFVSGGPMEAGKARLAVEGTQKVEIRKLDLIDAMVMAADAAVMVLDAAKGIEPQTLKLFEVCRDRGLPLLTFINKWDRPGRDGLELLDEIESMIGVQPTPVTWPVGFAGDFRGVVDRLGGRPLDDEFRAGLRAHLERARLAGFDLDRPIESFDLDGGTLVLAEPDPRSDIVVAEGLAP